MAACGSLQHIFDNPLVPSCNQIIPMNLLDDSTTDDHVFSGYNLKDKTDSVHSQDHNVKNERHEGIIKHAQTKIMVKPIKRSWINRKEFPPPISSFGRRVCLKSYRCNGRLVIKEEKILTHEILHAYREDGRLKLCYIQFDDGIWRPNRNTKSENSNGNGYCVNRIDNEHDDDNMGENVIWKETL